MARTVAVKINGTEHHMPATLAASRDIADELVDPLRMAVNDTEHGPANWDIETVVTIIYIGLKHAGAGMDKDTVGEYMFEDGIMSYVQPAALYISAMVSGAPEKAPAGQKKATRSRSRGAKS